MKPIISESDDNAALLALGRASLQIVHDLKNQLNGLKLYATFLRKRLEKGERPADELETVKKLIGGLDRTAADLSMIVEYGHPPAIKKQTGTDLEKIMREVATNLNESPAVSGSLESSIIVEGNGAALVGDFDATMLASAFKSISIGALKMAAGKTPNAPLHIQLSGEKADGVIDWKLSEVSDHDPFHSFAGSNEIRLSLAARIIEAHGGSATREDGALRVRLPLTS